MLKQYVPQEHGISDDSLGMPFSLREQNDILTRIATSPEVLEGDVEATLKMVTAAAATGLDIRYVSVLKVIDSAEAVSSLLLYDHVEARELEHVSIPINLLPTYLGAIRSGSIIDASNARHDPRIAEWRKIYVEPMGIESMLDAGFRIGREISGVLCCASTERRKWREDEIRFVASLAAQVSLAVSNRELRRLIESQEQLNRLTCQDSLTGIGNRRLFDRMFAQYWNLARRQKKSLTLALLDIDHFKQFNDEHGHQAGDHCLRAVARTLHTLLHRQSDVVARVGGEEFGLLLPDTSLDGAVILLERVLDAIKNQAIILPNGQVVSVAFSAGIASMSSSRGDMQALYAEADHALYQAKAAGRACIRRSATSP